MPQLEIDGAQLAYFEKGEGEPVVLIHGSASDHRTWEHLHGQFGESFRAIAYSRRYHWPNEPIPDGVDYAMAAQAEDLGAVLRALDAAPAHLIGHSYGAFLALLLAMQEPDLIRSLVLAEPPALTLFVSNTPKPQEILRLLFTRPRTAGAILRFGAAGPIPAGRAFRGGDMEGGLRIFGNAAFGPGGYDRLSEPRKNQARDNLPSVRAEFLGSGFAPLPADSLRRIQAPVLLVNGARSIALFRLLTDRLEELLPHTERAVIAGASHMMHEDNPTAFMEAVISFLNKHSQ